MNAPEQEDKGRSLADRRRWAEAHGAVRRDVVVSWPLAMSSARAMTDEQIDAARKGCNEETCIRHGAMVAVRNERRAIQ